MTVQSVTLDAKLSDNEREAAETFKGEYHCTLVITARERPT